MSVITISQSGHIISVNQSGGSGIVTLTDSGIDVSTVIINQGQQGPAGVSITVDNYGNNRITTSDGTPGGLYAESDLTFDGSFLRISGTPVSLSGHSHILSDIQGISGAISSGIDLYLSSLPNISNECDTKYFVIQTISNNTQLLNIADISNVISTIDGGGVLYSGC